MAQKNYKGVSGKTPWVNQHYAQGIEYSNATHREGVFKSLVNWNITPSGVSLKPRTPLFGVLFKLGDDAPITLLDTTFMMKPLQSEDKEYLIQIGGPRIDKEEEILYQGTNDDCEETSGIYVIDGDTISLNGQRYRLLGIDAPELNDDDGDETTLGAAARDYLRSRLFVVGSLEVTIKFVYDKHSEGDYDVYGRKIGWLLMHWESNGLTWNLNRFMLQQGHARLMGEYDIVPLWDGSAYPDGTVVKIPDYEEVSAATLNLDRTTAYNANRGIWAVETEGRVLVEQIGSAWFDSHTNFTIYSKEKAKALEAYQEYAESLKIPTMGIENATQRLNFSTVYRDLDIDYGEPFKIEILTTDTSLTSEELDRYTRYDPVTYVPYTDTFIFIGKVTVRDEEVYRGMISLRYAVPLDGNIPQFDKFYFEVSTFKDNVYKIKYEDQEYNSPNLLDTDPISLRSLYGQDAIDEGYDELEIIALVIKNADGQIIDQPEFGEIYTIEPIVAMPSFVADHDNGFDGYAIKWEVWNGSEYELHDRYKNAGAGTDGWRIAWDSVGVRIYDYPNAGHGIRSARLDHLDPDYYIAQTYLLVSNTYALETESSPFHWSPNNIDIKCSIAKVKLDDTDTYSSGDDELYDGPYSVITPVTGVVEITMAEPYTNNETLETNYQHAQDLSACTKIAHFDTRVLLYGNPKAENIIYMSDDEGNIKYFPFNYALDRVLEKIIYVHSYQEFIIVFSTNNIYVVFAEVDEFGVEKFYTKLLMSNITIKESYINTVTTIGRDILFMSNSDELKMLRPNIYVESGTDMLMATLSDPIKEMLINPNQFITKRLQYYNRAIDIFNSEWKPTIEVRSHVYNNKVYLYHSVSLPDTDDPYMFICIFDLNNRRWTIHDTTAVSFPYNFELYNLDDGPYILTRNHLSLNGGVTLLLFESLNLWEFDDGYGKLRDSKPVKIVDDTFVFNSALTTDDEAVIEEVKIPINVMVNPGYLDITPHLMKRFMQFKFVITNTDCIVIPMTMEFAIDGRTRQTANAVRMQQITDVNDPNYGQVQAVHVMEPFEIAANSAVEGGITFKEWQLGVSKFGPLNKLEIKFGISGRGKIPSLEFGFKVTGMFELFNYTLIYKEQSAR